MCAWCWVRCSDVILAQIAIPIGRGVKQYLHLKLVSSNFQRIEIQSTQNTAPAACSCCKTRNSLCNSGLRYFKKEDLKITGGELSIEQLNISEELSSD